MAFPGGRLLRLLFGGRRRKPASRSKSCGASLRSSDEALAVPSDTACNKFEKEEDVDKAAEAFILSFRMDLQRQKLQEFEEFYGYLSRGA